MESLRDSNIEVVKGKYNAIPTGLIKTVFFRRKETPLGVLL